MINILLSVLSGVLIFLTFPDFNFSFLAWVALIPLLAAVEHRNAWQSFGLGFGAGFAAYCGILYWLIVMTVADGEHWLFGVLLLFLLSAILAVFYGLFCLGLTLFSEKHRLRFTYLLFVPSLWVSLELLRTHIFSGFPWALLAYSQWHNAPLIQVSEVTGAYGISFLIVFVNTAIWRGVKSRGKNAGPLVFAVCLFIANTVYGHARLRAYDREPSSPGVKAGILQGNIDQYMKWDRAYEKLIIDSYSGLVEKIKNEKPDIIVWPETALPGYLLLDYRIYDWVRRMARFSGSYNIVGSPDMREKKGYNSAFLVSPEGEVTGRYDKIHLVPFGEFVPFRAMIYRFVEAARHLGEFNPGREYRLLETPFGNFGVAVCWESIFPSLTRRIVLSGADYLVNITNDAWYMRTAAARQHFTINIFRAVENRIDIIRSANTGISGFISRSGRVRKQTEIFVTACLTDTVAKRGKDTFYTSRGNVFVFICVIFSVLVAAFRLAAKDMRREAKIDKRTRR